MICISSSTRFKEKILAISAKLKELNIEHYLPVLEFSKEEETDDMIPGLVQTHLDKIKNSKASFIINPGGYVGNSVKVEIGYAKGLGKKVFFLEKTNQPELDCLADGFIGDNLELLN